MNENQKKSRVAIFISGKIEFKIKNIIRDQEGHYIMIKGSIQEEDTTVVNTYAPNLQALQNIKQTLRGIRGETDNSTVIVHHLRHWTDHQNRDSVRKPNPK